MFLVYRSNRGTIHDMWNDPIPRFRIATRASFIAIIIWPVWVSLLDNWRQVMAIPTRRLQSLKLSYGSDPFVSDPTSDVLRAISWLTFFLAIAGGAYLYIRYARGYWGPAVITFVSVVFFFVVNSLRIRFDVDSVRIADANYDSWYEMGAAIFWTFGLWITFVLLIFSVYFIVWGPVTLIGLGVKRLITGDRKADENDTMFQWFKDRSTSTNHVEPR